MSERLASRAPRGSRGSRTQRPTAGLPTFTAAAARLSRRLHGIVGGIVDGQCVVGHEHRDLPGAPGLVLGHAHAVLVRAPEAVHVGLAQVRVPQMFIRTRRTARPIAVFAEDGAPGPKQPPPALMASVRAMGPFTSRSGVCGPVEHPTTRSRNIRSVIARVAAMTTGKCSGRQPAITALTAIFSTVPRPSPGSSTPTRWSGARRVPASIASTARRVGGRMGTVSRALDEEASVHLLEGVHGIVGNELDNRIVRSVPASRTSLVDGGSGQAPGHHLQNLVGEFADPVRGAVRQALWHQRQREIRNPVGRRRPARIFLKASGR